MSGKDSEKLPQIAVDYIDSVIKHVRYRKKIRNEVRQELEAHYIDAMEGCESEDQRQKRAQALIEGFGDIQLLAKLIRRGKKRCRPLWRTLVVRAFQLVGVLFLLLVLYIGWFFSGKPIITTNYLEKLNTQVRPVADESLNAQPFYEQAIKAYVMPSMINSHDAASEDDKVEFDTSPRNLSALTPEERQVLEQWLNANQDAMQLIEQGNQKPHYWRTYTANGDFSEMITVLLPNLQEFRQIARLLCFNGIAEAQAGHFEKAFDSVLECYSLGKHLRNQTILIEQLVAIAIESIATSTMLQIADEHAAKIPTELLNAGRARLETMMADEVYTAGFLGEKLFLYDEIQRSFTQTRIGGSHIYIQRIGQLMPLMDNSSKDEWLGKWFQLLFTHPDRQETLASAEEFYAAIETYAKYSPATLQSKGIDIEQQVNETVKGNLLLSMLTPALEKAIQIAFRNRADSEATLAVLAILHYQNQQGTLPESLNTLVDSGLLKSVPIDPFSDDPLIYTITGDTFMLYSVGPDFKDDGGTPARATDGSIKKWADHGDTVFWPAAK